MSGLFCVYCFYFGFLSGVYLSFLSEVDMLIISILMLLELLPLYAVSEDACVCVSRVFGSVWVFEGVLECCAVLCFILRK